MCSCSAAGELLVLRHQRISTGIPKTAGRGHVGVRLTDHKCFLSLGKLLGVVRMRWTTTSLFSSSSSNVTHSIPSILPP